MNWVPFSNNSSSESFNQRRKHMLNNLYQISAGIGLDQGGAALHGRLLARALQQYCEEREIQFEVLHLGMPTDVLSPIKVTHFFNRQLSMCGAIWRRLPRRDSAMIFDHLGPARAFGVVPRFVRLPYAITMLGIEVWEKMSWERRSALENADLRLAISMYTEQRARILSPWLPHTKILHLALEGRNPSGDINVELLNQVGYGFILVVGRLAGEDRYKGQDELIRAMPKVLTEAPDTMLVVVGKGNDLQRLEKLAINEGVSQRVVFTGFVTEATLEQLYQRCGVFSMPSKNEGFGLVFLEAMKAGKPTIALRDSSVAEIIVNEKTGVLIDNYGHELERALLRLLRNPELAKQMGEAGRDRWRRHFSEERYRFHLAAYLDGWFGFQREVFGLFNEPIV